MMRVSRFRIAVIGPLLILILTGQIAQADEPLSDQSAQAKLEAILATAIDIESEDASLREVVTGLATKHGFDVRFDEQELAARWVSIDDPISVRFKEQTIDFVLKALLQLERLEPRLEGGVVVIVCSPHRGERPRPTHCSFQILGLMDGVRKVKFSLLLEQKEDGKYDLADAHLMPKGFEARRRLIAHRAVYSLLGNQMTRETLVEGLELQLRQRIEAEHLVCGLSESQRQKLLLAGRGDVHRLVELADRLCDQFMESYEPGRTTVELPDEFLPGAFRLLRFQREFLRDDTLFSRLRGRLLTSAQKQRFAAASVLRKRGAMVIMNSEPVVGIAEIRLRNCPLDVGFSNLELFPELGTLSLEATQVTDHDLQQLKSVPDLVSLDLDKTAIGDEGLKHVAALTNLEWLELSETRVTDAGIETLLSLKNLKWVDLSETAVTDASVAKLRAAFPEITIPR